MSDPDRPRTRKRPQISGFAIYGIVVFIVAMATQIAGLIWLVLSVILF